MKSTTNGTPNGTPTSRLAQGAAGTPNSQFSILNSQLERSDSTLVTNFINQYRRPFSLAVVANLTSLPEATVQPLLLQLLTEKKIKEIEPGIYTVAGLREIYNSGRNKGHWNTWRYSVTTANLILDIIQKRRFTSVRGIAKAIGYSHQFAYMYMEALASIGCVGVDMDGYYVVHRDGLVAIGTKVEKGILSRMRNACGISTGGKGRPRKGASK